VEELWDVIGQHREHLLAGDGLERRRAARINDELRAIVAAALEARATAALHGANFETLAAQVAERTLDPYAAADQIVASVVHEH